MATPEPLRTTQDAMLERFLARQRTKRILPFIRNKRVLDFGCGEHAWAANQIFFQCQSIVGVDHNYKQITKVGNVCVYPSLAEIPALSFDIILALAVFEHIDPSGLIKLLHSFQELCSNEALIIGTVPTPRARPILEFLSLKLHLIDPTQIADHKVYYDDLWLSAIVDYAGWQLKCYHKFQFGCNSFFMLGPRGIVLPSSL